MSHQDHLDKLSLQPASSDASHILQLADFLPYRLNTLAGRISQALSAVYEQEFDLSIPEWRILATLGVSSEPLSAKFIGEQTWMDKAKVSRAMASLVSKGLVDRERERGDHRQSRITLSEAGWELYRRLVPKARTWEQALLAEMSDDDKAALHRLLGVLETSLNNG
ncbi:MarR family transcriptional regulator [Pokkaliibacter sp. MBI-7]|uniref:MarR family winged helix-turn-helix transcriptional regulator n=1 Tax=Pokkaliibacter sp. MBI-7 TaxID=3040600 RepID=UPI00244B770A|nr:MarR family transcriptional regulator [Pokkaliibacter sp. MBI-7]MDH2434963.1 MarR family transcriptional regulator [Pokkaliibacter sp. MBI-7]